VIRLFEDQGQVYRLRMVSMGTFKLEGAETDGSWNAGIELPILPDRILKLANGSFLLVKGRWMVLPDGRAIKFDDTLVHLSAYGARNKVYYALSAQKRLYRLNAQTGLPEAFDVHDAFDSNEQVKVYAKGAELTVVPLGKPAFKLNLPQAADEIRVQADAVLARVGTTLFRLEGQAMQAVAECPSGEVASWDVDLARKNGYALDQSGVVSNVTWKGAAEAEPTQTAPPAPKSKKKRRG
jgi:hypothetical protein